MSKTSRTEAVSESGVVYFKAGGHSHDGQNSSLIDTKKYSLFDFSVGQQPGSQDRITNQSRNEQSFRDYVIRLVNQSLLEPIGISLKDDTITSRHIIANSISAREIAANTITSTEIATDTITANNFSNTITLDAKIIKSNNYIAGTSGWVINGNGFAEFRNITIGGSSNINGLPIGNITTVVTNFETNNDQIANVPSDANSISFGSAIKNKDASIDLPVTWVYNQGNSTSNSFNIDGFVLYLRSSDTNNNANITIADINNSNVQSVYLTSNKRSHVFSGVPESTSYKAAIRAYRIVDSNIDANGILYSGFINSDIRNIGVPTIGGGSGINIGDGKIFIGAGNYANSDTGFFVDYLGKMSLKTSFIWDGNTLTIGNTATIGNQFVSNISNATYNFDRNNDRNATTPTAPTVASDGSALTQIQNPDSSTDITFNWSYTNSTAIGNAANIDGFVVYVRSSPTDTNPYTFGSGGVETPYYLPKDRRSFVLPGVPANYYYTFGVVAYRIVSSDINSQGILFSTIVKSTASGENPLRPFNNVEFAGNVTGNVAGLSANTLVAYANAGNDAAADFNSNNDRNGTTPTSPTIASNGTAIDHVINTDSSADISFEWSYTTSDVFDAANNIDGFVVYVRSSATGGAYTFGSNPVDETTYFLPRDKRAFVLPAVAANRYYNFGVAAYRVVDTDINASGIVFSPIIQSTAAGENPYQPSSVVAFAGDITGTIANVAASTVVAYANAGNAAASNFNTNNDRNATVPTSPVVASNGTAIDHVINTDSSADISFEWSYTTSDVYNAANNIDGFIVYVRSSTSSSPYTFGTTPVDETTYFLPRDKRAFVLPAVAANRYYNFGVAAYRVVDTDVNSAGVILSPIVQSTGAGENPYLPSSTVAFAGDITGTIANVAASTVVAYANAGNTAATNFNANNDRNATTPTSPVIASNGTAIDHVINTDGSADISFEWSYTTSDVFNAANNIDGFVVYLRSSLSSSPYTFGSSPVDETTFYLPRDKRAFVVSAVAANRYYNFGVAAYRIVDTDVNAAGVIFSPIIQSTGSGENPYQPSATVAFAGNITGTIDGVAANTVVAYATAGNTAATNFNANNDRNATTPTSPTINSNGTAIDHVINTDGSSDISFEWNYTVSDVFNAANNIDGFVIYVRSSTSNAAYTFGTTPSDETTYFVPRDKRAFILPAVAADRYYNFGVAAYRVVDTDINSAGIILSSVIQSTGSGENPYRPSATVAFAGNITGTIDGVSASTVVAYANAGNAAATNFNSNNDRNSTTPTSPVVASNGTAIDHVINTDSSADISFEWSYTTSNTPSDPSSIDGFIVYVRSSTSSSPYTFGSSPVDETTYYLPRDKRAFVLPAVAANRYYNFGVAAYRIVDTDVNSAGVVISPIIQSTGSGENPYLPSANVQFAGDITGTINGLSASVVSESAIDFFANNDRNALVPPAPGLLGGDETIDHVINTDGSADISFEWTYISSNIPSASNNIDGFIIYVHSSTTSDPYIFGESEETETVYYVTPEKRAFILAGVPADKYYTFGVQAYRIVDTDISNTNTVVSAITRSTTVGEGTGSETLSVLQGSEFWLDAGIELEPYRPASQVAFAGDITGTISSVAASAVATVTNNFNANNDRKNTTPAMANTLVFGNAIPNYNSSLDLPISWTFNPTNSTADQFDIDGFVLYLKTGSKESNTVTDISNTTFNNTSVQAFYITPNKRDHVFSGIEPSVGYKAAIRAYRIVDTDVAANYAGDKEGSMIFGPLLNSNVKTWQSPVLGGTAGITIGNGKIYIGNGFFNSSNTGFYVDSTGQMSLKNSLVWNGTTLTVNGVVNADSGVFKGSLDIGGPDNESLQVDTNGNLWIGHRNIASAPFRVSPTGELFVGASPDWLRVDAGGNVWTGGDTYANAKFRVQDTGNVRIGSGSPALYIANDGSITIGSAPGTGDFIVRSNGQVDVGGNDATSFHISPTGNIWSGAIAITDSTFRVDNTGNIRVGNAATSLYITNNGSITIGSTHGTGDFIVQSNGQVDIGGNDASSLHIAPSGNMWVGSGSTAFSTAPLKITNDGSIDIGTTDSQSLHISASGNVHVGAAKASFLTAPFSVIASNGDVKGNNITLSGQILGTATHLGKANVVNIIGNIAIGSSKIFATAGTNYDDGANYTLSAADGFLARFGTTSVISITAAGYDSILNVKTTANIYSGEYIRDNTSSELQAYSGGVTARWQDSNNGKILGKFSSSSKKYKKNIKNISDEDLDPKKLLKLRVVQFKYKKNYLSLDDQRYEKTVPGFIAEEVSNIYPIACDLSIDGEPETWNVNFIVPPMLKLIQELYEKIEVLEKRMDDCKCV